MEDNKNTSILRRQSSDGFCSKNNNDNNDNSGYKMSYKMSYKNFDKPQLLIRERSSDYNIFDQDIEYDIERWLHYQSPKDKLLIAENLILEAQFQMNMDDTIKDGEKNKEH
jgi:hypothetical protein